MNRTEGVCALVFFVSVAVFLAVHLFGWLARVGFGRNVIALLD